MIDSHTHLFDEAFDLDRDNILEQMKSENIKGIIVGFNDFTNQQALELSKKYDFLYNTAGLHPSDVKEDYVIKINNLIDFVENNKVYAIGECGLDYYWDKTFKEEQKEAFRKQISLSKELNLPIIIHSRDAIQETYDVLKEFGTVKGVMHCYSGSLEMAEKFISLGLYISFGGPLTFKNANEALRVAKNIDINKILIETDSPYLSPVPYRGKRNTSLNVKYVLYKLAEIKDVDVQTLEKIIDNNTNNLFKLREV